MIQMNLQNRNRLKELRTSFWLGEGEGGVRGLEMDRYTLLYLGWITSMDVLYSTGISVQCCVAAWMGTGFGEEWIHVYVWLSLFALHLRPSQHCLLIGYEKKVKGKVAQPFPALCVPMGYSPWNSPGHNTGVGSLSLPFPLTK